MAVEVSLQPWRSFKPDGVILFSDILTPLPGLNIPFDITAGQGPIIADPIRSMEQVNKVTPLDAEAAVPFVGETLRALKQEVRGHNNGCDGNECEKAAITYHGTELWH